MAMSSSAAAFFSRRMPRRVSSESAAEAPPPKKDHFPRKLYAMLEHAAATEHAAAASWVDDGRAFAIHDREAFLADLVPRFFKQTKYRSFTRQLNLWGFQRSSTRTVGKWEHPHFVRGDLEGLSAIERIEVKSAVGGPKTSKKRSERRKEAPATSGSRKAKRARVVSPASASSDDESTTPVPPSPTNSEVQLPPFTSSSNEGLCGHPSFPSMVQSEIDIDIDAMAQAPPLAADIVDASNGDDVLALLSGIFDQDESRDDDLSSILSLDVSEDWTEISL
ncbi:hypothetical protein ACHAXT_006117 [Thalassiosira profunda]